MSLNTLQSRVQKEKLLGIGADRVNHGCDEFLEEINA